MRVTRILAGGILLLLLMIPVTLAGCCRPSRTQSRPQGLTGRWILGVPDGPTFNATLNATLRLDGTGAYQAEAALQKGRRTGSVRLRRVAQRVLGTTLTWERVDRPPHGIPGEIYHLRSWRNGQPGGVHGIFRLEGDRLRGLTADGKNTGVDWVRVGSP